MVTFHGEWKTYVGEDTPFLCLTLGIQQLISVTSLYKDRICSITISFNVDVPPRLLGELEGVGGFETIKKGFKSCQFSGMPIAVIISWAAVIRSSACSWSNDFPAWALTWLVNAFIWFTPALS